MIAPLLAALLALLLFWAVGAVSLHGYVLDLGSIYLPKPLNLAFYALWAVFGTAAPVALAVALARSARADPRRFLERGSDRSWMAGAAAAAFLLPLAIRAWILHGAPLADDESCYRFMAELLAEGRLWAPSHPLKLFFDRGMMVNDGKLYAQYFLGWPALLAPFAKLGLPGLANPLYAAATVPALYKLLLRFTERPWARAGLLLWVSSPFLAVAASTELAHTTCLLALTWTALFALRSLERSARPGLAVDAGVAAAFSAAFFIRPQAALGIGLPLLVVWAGSLRRDFAWRRLVAFAAPAAVLAALFFAVNHSQTGGWATTAYARAHDYARENAFRFAADAQTWAGGASHFRFDRSPFAALGFLGIGLFRLSFDLFGGPLLLLAAFAAGIRGRAAIAWASTACFLLFHLYASDAGIDSFGPVHLTELALPVLLLVVLGLARSADALGSWQARPLAAALPAALLVATILVALGGFDVVRLRSLARVAPNINLPRDTVAAADLHQAVVFAPWPFAPSCLSAPTQHHVRFRPNNDPELGSDVLWVNHLSLEEDRRLIDTLPGRAGFVMLWTPDCRVELLPLASLAPGQVADGRQQRTRDEPPR